MWIPENHNKLRKLFSKIKKKAQSRLKKPISTLAVCIIADPNRHFPA